MGYDTGFDRSRSNGIAVSKKYRYPKIGIAPTKLAWNGDMAEYRQVNP